MSRNIVIQEGGVGRQFTADKLKTNLVSGGTCLWVPEEDVQLTIKTITKNGTYKASKDGYYGYDKVIVNVAGGGSISGKGADGNDYSIDVDENGNIVETKIPSSIVITTPPTYTGPYGDRAYISFDGLVVTAYDANGNSMGEVPFSKLVFPVTVTDVSQATSSYSTATSQLMDEPVAFGYPPIRIGPETGTKFIVDGGMYAFVHNGSAMCVSTQSETVYFWEEWGTDPTEHNKQSSGMHGFTYDGKTAYMGGFTFGSFDICNLPINTGDFDNDHAAWTILYGTVESHGGQEIPVQWPRTGDGKVLETSFNITVVDTSYTPGGGSTVDDGHGGSGGSF